jgi:RNA polymerase sigma-70 factor (ECF subfamily)
MTCPGRETSDSQRFDTWVRDHGPTVRRYLWAILRHSDLADDLAQEVFARAWQARRRYRERGNARAYLLKIADRLVVDHARRSGWELGLDEKGWRQHEPAGETENPAKIAVQNEAMARLAAAMDALSIAQRRVLLLRYYGQLSFAEIAETLDCPLNTALSHCRRGLEALRKMLVEKPA